MAHLIEQPGIRALSSIAVPVSGAKAYVFDAGTSTPRATYPTVADAEAATNPQAHPVVANSVGVLAPMYARPAGGPYKIDIRTSAGVSLSGYPIDNLEAFDIGSYLTSFLSTYLTQSIVGTALFPRTAIEVTASITPTNYAIPSHDAVGYVNPARYGATGDGTTDDRAAIVAAISVAQAGTPTMAVEFSAGVFCISSKITITGAGRGIILKGSLSALRGGSARPATALRYTGSATPVFDLDNTFTEFWDFSVENAGSATTFIRTINDQGGRLRLQRISCVPSADPYEFSSSFVEYTKPSEYQSFDRLELTGVAPVVFRYNGNDASNSITTWRLTNSIIESDASSGNSTMLKITNGGIELLEIRSCTFNAQGDSVMTVVDATDINATDTSVRSVETLLYAANEWDNSSTQTTARMLKLKNFHNARILSCGIEAGGNPVALINLTTSVVCDDSGNRYAGINGPVYSVDATSRIYFGKSEPAVGNSKGMTSVTSGMVGIIDLTYATTMTILPHYGWPGGNTTFSITVTNGTAFAINVGVTADAPPNTSYSTRGQHITVRIRNTSGGAVGTITWQAVFKMAAWTSPANGFSETITFEYDGTNWVEWGARSLATIPN